MPKVHHVKKARKDNSVCKKGESYYWWKFRFGGKHYSLTQPKASQLTQSDFLGQIYDIQDRIEALTTDDNFESEIEEICGELENLQSECEDKRSNMPEQLQESGSGEILQNRADECGSMMDELQGIDVECDEMQIEDDVKMDSEKEENETEEEFQERLEQEINDAIEERKEEILSEIQGVSYNGE